LKSFLPLILKVPQFLRAHSGARFSVALLVIFVIVQFSRCSGDKLQITNHKSQMCLASLHCAPLFSGYHLKARYQRLNLKRLYPSSNHRLPFVFHHALFVICAL